MKRTVARWLASPCLWGWLAPRRYIRSIRGRRLPRLAVSHARRILVIRPDEIGDIVLMSAFFRELRAAAPTARITVAVKRACLALVETCPYIDYAVVYDWEAVGPGDARPLRMRVAAARTRFRALAGSRFDLVLLPRRDVDWYGSDFLAHLCADHAVVVAHRETIARQLPAPWPLEFPADIIFENPCIEHEVHHALSLLRFLGASPGNDTLELWPTAADREHARAWLAARFPHSAPLIVIHPSGGRSALKQWPVTRYQETLAALAAEYDRNFVIIGGPGEAWLVEPLRSTDTTRIVLSIGEHTLRELAALLGEATLFIGGDSGPMHIAAAMGTPVLAIFGPTSEQRFRPWSSQSQVVSLHYECSPDLLRTYENRCTWCRFPEPYCLTKLSAEAVVAAAQAVLQHAIDDRT